MDRGWKNEESDGKSLNHYGKTVGRGVGVGVAAVEGPDGRRHRRWDLEEGRSLDRHTARQRRLGPRLP